MISQPYRRIVLRLVPVVMSIGTAWLFHAALLRDLSTPRPVSGPLLPGYQFTVVAMEGASPAEMMYEWAGTKAPDGARVVGTKRNGADAPYRYYLTASDLPKVNTQLDAKSAEHPRDVQVRILEDLPSTRSQTLEVVVHGEDTDFINVYRVNDDHVQPIKWLAFRPRVMAPVLLMLPVVIAVSWGAWKWMVRNALSVAN